MRAYETTVSDPPPSSAARYLSSMRLASVLLTVTSSSGGCISGSKTVWASDMSTSRQSKPTVWNCKASVATPADCNLARTPPSCRSTNGQPVARSGMGPDADERRFSRSRSSIGLKSPVMYCRRDLYVGRSPLLHFPYHSHKSEYGTGFCRPFAFNRAVN